MFKHPLKTIPHSAHGHGAGTERDKPASAFIAQMSVALVILLAVIWYVFEGLLWAGATHVEQEFLQQSDMKHAELRMTEEAQLHQYGVANEEKGLYQIPIDQAIDKLVSRGSLDIRK